MRMVVAGCRISGKAAWNYNIEIWKLRDSLPSN